MHNASLSSFVKYEFEYICMYVHELYCTSTLYSVHFIYIDNRIITTKVTTYVLVLFKIFAFPFLSYVRMYVCMYYFVKVLCRDCFCSSFDNNDFLN